MRRASAVTAALAASALASGCGGSSGDLLAITASGGTAGGTHTVVVSGDGRGSCDRGPLEPLPSGRVLTAREVEHDAVDIAKRAASYPPSPDARAYTLRTKDGVVRWSEGNPTLPKVLPQAQLLALQLEQQLCRR
jgi:hypothetical protein